jgi:hypothetical protein
MDHIEYGQRLADSVFKKRKAKSEIHVSQIELAAMLAMAYEAGQKSTAVAKQ